MSRKIAIIGLVVVAGLYLAGLGTGLTFNTDPEKDRYDKKRSMSQGKFDPQREFPLLGILQGLTGFFGPEASLRPGEGLRPDPDCKVINRRIFLTHQNPVCKLTIESQERSDGEGIRMARVNIRPRPRSLHARIYLETKERRCRPKAPSPQTVTVVILYQPEESTPTCDEQADSSKPVTLAVDDAGGELVFRCPDCERSADQGVGIEFQ